MHLRSLQERNYFIPFNKYPEFPYYGISVHTTRKESERDDSKIKQWLKTYCLLITLTVSGFLCRTNQSYQTKLKMQSFKSLNWLDFIVHTFGRILALLSDNLLRLMLQSLPCFFLPLIPLIKSSSYSLPLAFHLQVSLWLTLALCSMAWDHHLLPSSALVPKPHPPRRVDMIRKIHRNLC